MNRLFLILSLTTLLACDNSQGDLQKELQKTISDGIKSISTDPSIPIEEVKKLSQLEYKTVTLPIDSSPSTINEELNSLGKDRWDCASIFPRPRTAPEKPEIVLVCKRTPETVLRYVPRGLLGGR